MSRALKKQRFSTPYLQQGLRIFIVPATFRVEDFIKAAKYLGGMDVEDDWVREFMKIFASPDSRTTKKARATGLTVFDLSADLSVAVVGHTSDVPAEVKFAASAVLEVARLTGRHIQAARRLLHLGPFSDEMAEALAAAQPQEAIVAALLRPQLTPQDLPALLSLSDSSEDGPDLSNLPGYEAAKVWATEIAADVAGWRAGTLSWDKIGVGAMIAGPPGTGKTYFASAFAKATRLTLVTATIGGWQAAGALDDTLKAMRASFAKVADSGGAVLFIDEADSIGDRRIESDRRNGNYWRIVINEFLHQLNCLAEGVIVLAATNFPDAIDPAILRSGRIEKRFNFELPDANLRARILRYHLGPHMELDPLREIADHLDGWTQADLSSAARDSRRRARRDGRQVTLGDLKAKLPELVRYPPEDLLRLAAHEAGHALTALSVGYAHSATIAIKDSYMPKSRHRIGGTTSYDPVQDHFTTNSKLLDRIAVSLGGMAAEFVVFGDRSLGSGGRYRK